MRTRVLLVVPLALALAGPAVARADSPASVRVKSCKTGARPDDRSARYEARMRSVSGSVRMALRFKLLVQEQGDEARRSVSIDKLNTWHRSHRGVTRYVYSQTVKHLRPGASYRMQVRFRWYDDRGNVIKTAKRLSRECVQDAPLPKLNVESVGLADGLAPGKSVYTVSVANTGRGPAESFSVTLFVDGALADSGTVDRLEPGESTTVHLNGPTCVRLRAVVDRERAVAETVEDDNALTAAC